MLKLDIVREATRLTHSGQLAEATALLQRMLRGENAPDITSPTPHHSTTTEREPPTIDAKAHATETRSPRRTVRPPVDLANNPPGLGLGRSLRRAPPSPADIVPNGAKFVEGSYGNAAGSRTYRLFIPSGYHGQAIPLVIMLHGCTQSPEDFAAGTRMNELAEALGFIVAYPAQPKTANASKCWNWFQRADQRRDRGEPSLIAGITREIIARHPVDAGRVYIAGLSAGGAAAAIMAETYPDLYCAAGIHSGLACGAARDVATAFAAMKSGPAGPTPMASAVPSIIFHGDSDKTVNPVNAAAIVASAPLGDGGRVRTLHGRSEGGKAYRRTVYHDANGRAVMEHWSVGGGGHAWFGGSPAGSYTDPAGPDASREMIRFFFEHRRG